MVRERNSGLLVPDGCPSQFALIFLSPISPSSFRGLQGRGTRYSGSAARPKRQ